MSMTIRYELQLLAASLTVGICLMMVYDGLRLFRTLIPHGNFWTGIEDAVYWAGSSITTFLLLFGQNDGILRWYAIFGVLMGMLVYNLTYNKKNKTSKAQAEAAGRGREAAPPERTETKGKERAKTSTARRKAETQGRGTERKAGRKAAALAGEGSEETDSFKRERGTGITQEQKGGRGERCGKAEE